MKNRFSPPKIQQIKTPRLANHLNIVYTWPIMYLNPRIRRFLALGLLFAFLGNGLTLPPAYADVGAIINRPYMPAPGTRIGLSPAFNPPVLKGLKVHPDNPFRFDFILDQGDSLPLVGRAREGDKQEELKQEANKLIKYFLASLTVPEKDLWVNLSPYEKDRIVPTSFGQTEMGRDLLAQDYLLKQITASLIYPEDEFGKKFWNRIYQEAAKRYGTTNIPVNTFNKVWIVPEKAVVYENAQAGTAYVVESKLKVMLEQDYLALEHQGRVLQSHYGTRPAHQLAGALSGPAYSPDQRPAPRGDVNALGSQVVREIVIPALTKEVNENKNFAQLRQVYNSLILATWYKKKIKDSILLQVYADKNKISGIGYATPTRGHVPQNVSPSTLPTNQALNVKAPQGNPPNDVEAIYQQYLTAFKKGVYNYIKEEQDPITQQMIPRKYFSGGATMGQTEKILDVVDEAMLGSERVDRIINGIKKATLVILTAGLVLSPGDTRPTHLPHQTTITLDKSVERTITDAVNTLPYFEWRVMGAKDNLKVAQFIDQNLMVYYAADSGPIRQVNRPTVFYRDIPQVGPAYIAAMIPGTEGARRRHIVLSAHFDTRSMYGADDNGSGISSLLAIARAAVNYTFRDNVYFIFTNDEEYGKLGARAAVKDLQDVGINDGNVFFIDIDSIGQSHLSLSKEGTKPDIWLSKPIVSKGQDAVSVLEKEVRNVLSNDPPFNLHNDINDVSAFETLPSDASAYTLYGYPALTVSGIPWGKSTILHTEKDSPDKVSPTSIYQITRWILSSLHQLARGEKDIVWQASVSYIPLTSAGIDRTERNYLTDTQRLFESYGLSFQSRHAVSLDEYELLSRWMSFIREKFPGYREHFKGIIYDLSSGIAHANRQTRMIEFGFPLRSKAIWLPYGYSLKSGVWYASADLVLTHELGHFISEDGLRKQGVDLHRSGYIGDLHTPEELFATDLALWLLYGNLKSAPAVFLDHYIHGDYDFKTGQLTTIMKEEPKNIVPWEIQRMNLIKKAAQAVGISIGGGWTAAPVDINPFVPKNFTAPVRKEMNPVDSKDTKKDKAMLNKGGIDLNAVDKNLQVKMDSLLRGNDKEGVKFNINPVILEQLQNAPGFVPVIINIQPMNDLHLFLGIQN
ncbi:MAG: M28 family peptidase [Candidatus Omnitrophota bacterium]|nr:M28 family peptidase [Candidatus Omnitrophota bacterium]